MNKFFSTVVVCMTLTTVIGCQSKPQEQSGLPADQPQIVLEESNPLNPESGLRSSASTTEQSETATGSDVLATTETSTTVPTIAETEIPGPYVKPTIEQIQQALKSANLYEGSVDGSLGPKTKKAIRIFQEQNDLAIDGKVGPKTWQKLAPYLQQIQGTQSYSSDSDIVSDSMASSN